MLLNFSNHPIAEWSDYQKSIAIAQYSELKDLNFPHIDPCAKGYEIDLLVEKYVVEIRKINPFAIHIMGEQTFTFKLITELKNIGFLCIASTTERNTIQENDTKVVKFEFVQFREY